MSGTQYDDPNRESLGLPPIWSETGDNVPDPPPIEGRKTKAKDDGDDEPEAKSAAKSEHKAEPKK